MGISIYTSIPAKTERYLAGEECGATYQAACIHSWQSLGLQVVSLNHASELSVLKLKWPEIRFVEVASERARLAEFIAAARASGESIAAIINADCLMFADEELWRAILMRAGDGMVICERINLDPMHARPTGQSSNGFDAFIFETRTLGRIEVSPGLMFGQPWWDYEYPIAYSMAGAIVTLCTEPILFHLDHPQNWSQAAWVANAERVVGQLRKRLESLPEQLRDDLLAFAGGRPPVEGDYGRFAWACHGWLKSQAKLLRHPANPDFASLLNHLACPQDRALFAMLNEAHAALDGERQKTAEAHAALDGERQKKAEAHAALDGERQKTAEATRILASRNAMMRHFLRLYFAKLRRRPFHPLDH